MKEEKRCQVKRSQREDSAQRKNLKFFRKVNTVPFQLTKFAGVMGFPRFTYYHWRKQAREAMLKGFNGAFNKKSKREHELEDKIIRLQNTILEITQENVDLKKKIFK